MGLTPRLSGPEAHGLSRAPHHTAHTLVAPKILGDGWHENMRERQCSKEEKRENSIIQEKNKI